MLLDACLPFCHTLTSLVGEKAVELIAVVGGLVLVWYRGRVQTKAVAVRADDAVAQAQKAKTEARAAQVQLAEIRGSLRPSILAPEGLAEAVVIPAHPPPVEITHG